MKRDDFIFTIGYDGDTAIVDKVARRRWAGRPAADLMEAGLYRAAFCAALFDDDAEGYLALYRDRTGDHEATVDRLKRQYGVFDISDGVGGVSAIG